MERQNGYRGGVRTEEGGGGLGSGWRVKNRKHKESMVLPEMRLPLGRRQGRSGDECEVQGCLGVAQESNIY